MLKEQTRVLLNILKVLKFKNLLCILYIVYTITQLLFCSNIKSNSEFLGMEEAVENRNYLAKRMTEEIMVRKFQIHNTYIHVIK